MGTYEAYGSHESHESHGSGGEVEPLVGLAVEVLDQRGIADRFLSQGQVA